MPVTYKLASCACDFHLCVTWRAGAAECDWQSRVTLKGGSAVLKGQMVSNRDNKQVTKGKTR